MIALAPFEDLAAMAVLSRLDPNDLIEAQLVRGEYASHLALFSDWRAMQQHAVLSLVLKTAQGGGVPFAVLALSNTGQAGVAQAALLARDHNIHRWRLRQAGALIRRRMPEFCAKTGIHRIEARCWRDHPSASKFLTLCGFHREADLPGFGHDGLTTFQQFAWTAPHTKGT